MEEVKNLEMAKKPCRCKFGLWQIIAAILLIITVVSVLTGGFGLKLFGASPDKLAKQTVEFINQYLLQAGSTASLITSECNHKVSLCKFKIDVSGAEYDSYVSSDGQILFPDAIEIEKFKEQQISANQEQQVSLEDLPRAEKPEVDLFIMSYCPYGLQAQKAMLPAMDLLKDKADIKIRFVDYIMHDKQEIDENLRQYCIQKEEQEKYTAYLNCFVIAGEFEKCLTEAKINKTKMNNCISQTDKEYKISANYEDKSTWLNGNYPAFNVEADLNDQYNVQGSPTLVINGQEINVNRTPNDYKEAICFGFESMPEECAQELSAQSSTPSFGLEAGESTDAECQ
ncbi:MAG: hypothetical protein PHW15_02900 [Patescibacteria group bacterium]|jgi:protein-disulfide isomerase|nr:hypothetical protein [Patescibacteria group bacterium]MDD5172831.1 hypothetical protein [Patescibacteria group bacterium]